MGTGKLVVYSLFGRISYIGEYSYEDDEKIVLKKVLLVERGQNQQGEEVVQIGCVPYASRESNVTIFKKVSPGYLVDEIDADLIKYYEKEIIASYSKLKIA